MRFPIKSFGISIISMTIECPPTEVAEEAELFIAAQKDVTVVFVGHMVSSPNPEKTSFFFGSLTLAKTFGTLKNCFAS